MKFDIHQFSSFWGVVHHIFSQSEQFAYPRCTPSPCLYVEGCYVAIMLLYSLVLLSFPRHRKTCRLPEDLGRGGLFNKLFLVCYQSCQLFHKLFLISCVYMLHEKGKCLGRYFHNGTNCINIMSL